MAEPETKILPTCMQCTNPMRHVDGIGAVRGSWVCDLCELAISETDDPRDESKFWWL